MQDGWIRLSSFPEPISANLAKSKLESEGIEAHLTNENTIRMDYFYSQALGGVQLFVAEEDLARAQAALAGNASLEEIEEAEGETPVPEQSSVRCPSCGSDNIYNDKRPRKVSLVAFFLGLPFMLFRRNRRCAACSHEW